MRVADVIMSFPSAAAGRGGVVRVLAERRQYRCGAGDHPYPGVPAHGPRRVRRAGQPGARRRGPHVRRQPDLDHHAPCLSGGTADAADGGHAGLLLRHAGGVLAELPGHRHSATRRQLGPDGVAGPYLPAHRLVAVVLPRRGHRHHHGLGDHPRRLGPDRHGSRSAAWRPHRPAKRLSRFTKTTKALS